MGYRSDEVYRTGLQVSSMVCMSMSDAPTRPLRFRGTSPLAQQLLSHRDDVTALLTRAGVRNPRVFGSVVRGEDHSGSDIDLLVDLPDGFGLFDLARLERDVSRIVGVPVDLVPARSLRENLQGSVLHEATPL